MNPQIDRRSFLKTATLAGLGAAALGHRAFAQAKGANDKIVLGLIGCGNMGRHNLKTFLELPSLEIGAVCDVDARQAEQAVTDVLERRQRPPKVFTDFRQLLEQKDIDAVILATPDHWHAIPFIAACEAGKDIYCEKPVSQTFVESRAMLAAAKHFQRVVQVGTWQRSAPQFRQAIDFVRAGRMGKIQLCRAWSAQELTSIGRQTPTAPPAGLDWNFWRGPALHRGYQPNRCHGNWRWFYDTGGGLMTDWGVHMIDIVLLAMNESDPITVHSEGGIFLADDDRETPDTMQTLFRFPKWQLHWEQRQGNPRGLDGGKDHGSEFIGEKGTLIVDRFNLRWFPAIEGDTESGPGKAERGGNSHHQNFLDCIKNREQPRADIASMVKTTQVCQLGNISWQTGATVGWDRVAQDVTSRSARHAPAYEYEYRKPWKLKSYKT